MRKIKNKMIDNESINISDIIDTNKTYRNVNIIWLEDVKVHSKQYKKGEISIFDNINNITLRATKGKWVINNDK